MPNFIRPSFAPMFCIPSLRLGPPPPPSIGGGGVGGGGGGVVPFDRAVMDDADTRAADSSGGGGSRGSVSLRQLSQREVWDRFVQNNGSKVLV